MTIVLVRELPCISRNMSCMIYLIFMLINFAILLLFIHSIVYLCPWVCPLVMIKSWIGFFFTTVQWSRGLIIGYQTSQLLVWIIFRQFLLIFGNLDCLLLIGIILCLGFASIDLCWIKSLFLGSTNNLDIPSAYHTQFAILSAYFELCIIMKSPIIS